MAASSRILPSPRCSPYFAKSDPPKVALRFKLTGFDKQPDPLREEGVGNIAWGVSHRQIAIPATRATFLNRRRLAREVPYR